MTTDTALDLATLALIRPEVERALDDTAAALSDAADADALTRARRLLSGLPETLGLAGVRGLPQVVVAIDALLADLQVGDLGSAGERVGLCRRACTGVRELLDDPRGLANPLPLAPVYGQLLRARGDDRPPELDLFFPDLSTVLDEPDAQPGLDRTVDVRASLAAHRVRYQEALLRWLRSPEAGPLADMQSAIEGAAQVARTPRLRTFWRAAGALMDLVAAGVLTPQPPLKRLCSALDQELRRSGDGGDPGESCLRTILFLIWGAPRHADTDRVMAVRHGFALDAIARGGDDGARNSLAAAARVRAALDALKGQWELACEGERGALPDFQWQVGVLRAACAQSAGMEALLELVAQAAKRDPVANIGAAVDVAIVLLVLDSLTAPGADPARLPQRAQEWAARLRAADGQRRPDLADDSSRDALFREAISSELLAGLMRVQERLGAFFEDASRRGELDVAAKALAEVRGALVVLGEWDAARALEVALKAVANLATRTDAATEQEIQRVAGVVSAVLHFVEQMRYGGADVAALLDQIGHSDEMTAPAPSAVEAAPAPSARAAGAAPIPAQPSPAGPVDRASDPDMLAVFIEEAREVLVGMADAAAGLRSQPGDAEALTRARRAAHTLKGSGRMVGLTHLGEVAWAVERALNRVLEQKLPGTEAVVRLVDLAAQRFGVWVEQLERRGETAVDGDTVVAWAEALRKGEPLPAAADASASQSLPGHTVEVGAVRLSPALYRAYVSEAEQRLGHMLACFDALRADQPAVSEAFVHAAHTLAGISGTTGFGPAYELGEQLELVLMQLHRSPVPIEAADRELIGRTLAALATMVASVRRRQAPEPATHLVAALQALHRRLDAALHGANPPPSAPPPDALAANLAAIAPAPVVMAPPPSAAPLGDRRNSRLQDDPDEALLPVFLQEANDLVPQVGHWLREWRGQRDNAEVSSALQRLLHTLKGSARMAGAMAIGELTHSMEARVAGAIHTPVVPDSLLDGLEASLDRLGLLMDRLVHRDQLGAPRIDGGVAPAQAPGPAAASQQPMLRVRAALVDRLVNEAGELAVTRARAQNDLKGLRLSLTELTDSIIRLRAQVREIEIQAESQIQSRTAVSNDAHGSTFDPLEFDRYTRLQELTRFLAESVNDLATVQQGMLQQVDGCNAGLTAQGQITRVLQDELMGMRLTPVAALTDRLYRVARLTARDTGKPVRFDIVGGQVQMDRAVVERMAGPLEHLLRNAIVHGIESADARRAAGKPASGQVTLEVRQEGNEVSLIVSDDGAGLDLDALRRKALELGVIAPSEPISDPEAASLVFAAGVSTAREITQAAGRGVGLDAVRSEVNAIGGRVEVRFERGHGTRFLIHLPLTLSVLHALVVRAGDRPYALPAQLVDQVRTVKPEALEDAYAHGVVSFQGRDYTVRHLQHLLGEPQYAPPRQRFNPLVLVRSATDCLALHVDELAGNQEVVIKGIGEQVARVTGITGAAMLASGEAVLILNPVLLAQGRAAARGAPVWSQPPAPAIAPLRPVVLVVDDSITVRKVTGRLLARAGYEPVEARDGVEALERLAELKPDLVLTDIEMPRMDGFDLVRQLRADSRSRAIPIIVISSRTADKHRKLALELGADLFLGKPYQDDDLLAHVARFAGASAAALPEPGV
jgi:chemosensory pili system protein ChpA (sensor histidine kinase/response regulator)